MRVAQMLVRRTVILSAAVLIVCAVISVMCLTALYHDRIDSRVSGQVAAAVAAIDKYYARRDVGEMRSVLTTMATNACWVRASFVNLDGQVMWSYPDARKHVGRIQGADDEMSTSWLRGAVSRELQVSSLSGVPFGKMVVQVPVVHDRRALILQVSTVLSGYGVLWLCYALLIWSIAERTLDPVRLLSVDVRSEAERMGLRLGESSMDEVVQIRTWFQAVRDQWCQEKERAVEYERFSSVGKIASQVAHDVRSPLSVLRTLFTSSNLVCHDTALLEAAKRSLRKIEYVLDDVLDTSRARQLTRSSVNFKTLLERVVNHYQDEARSRNVVVRCSVAPEWSVVVDEYKMERVLSNLVLNAVEAHDAPGEVVVAAAVVGQMAVVEVRDDGKGIPRSVMDKLWSHISYGKPHGTGLGLAYCKQVIEAHGGTIEVVSEVGRGTTFTIRIPNRVLETKIGQCVFDQEQPASFTSVAARGQRFLIVDDDPAIRAQLTKLIDDRGGRVVFEAASPEQVVSTPHISDRSVDAAIIDYHYEGSTSDGIDVIHYLKAKGIHRLHLCTGYADDPEVCRRAIAAGACGVMGKPLDEETFLSVV